jgi:hypothetical protein
VLRRTGSTVAGGDDDGSIMCRLIYTIRNRSENRCRVRRAGSIPSRFSVVGWLVKPCVHVHCPPADSHARRACGHRWMDQFSYAFSPQSWSSSQIRGSLIWWPIGRFPRDGQIRGAHLVLEVERNKRCREAGPWSGWRFGVRD